MTVEKLIIDHIDIWSSALQTRSTAGRGSNGKIDLYGIKKLRELILELAVRGKLVPQDPNDEPASELLNRIAAEKAELVKQGKIKKQKPLLEISEDEKPFELPVGWEWVRFGDLSEIERGGSPRPIKDFLTTAADGLNWIKIGDTDIGGKYITSVEEKIKPSGLHKTRKVYPGDFLLTNSMSFGRPYITLIEGCIHDGWLRISPPPSLDKDFLYQLLSSPFIIKSFREKASGAVVLNLNADKVRETFILIPPFAEQQRIVAKVNELMSLCDQLEQQSLTSLDAHQQLVDALLTTLTDSQNAEELAENWARISQHFDTLFTTEASIDALKQTILQLAVMGKLVPQDPNDEPASELLKRIEQEKSKLIARTGLKTSANDVISTGDVYLNTPEDWAWIRLGNLAKFIDYRGKTPNKINSGVRLITAKNIRYGYIDLQPEEFISESDYISWMTRGFPKNGDVLFTTEAPLGNVAVIDLSEKFALAQRAICFQWHIEEISPFMLLQIMASPFQKQLVINASGMTATGIKASKLKEIPVVVPPLEEQHLIVNIVKELFNLCEALKSRLQSAQQTQLHLADALADAALN